MIHKDVNAVEESQYVREHTEYNETIEGGNVMRAKGVRDRGKRFRILFVGHVIILLVVAFVMTTSTGKLADNIYAAFSVGTLLSLGCYVQAQNASWLSRPDCDRCKDACECSTPMRCVAMHRFEALVDSAYHYGTTSKDVEFE